MEHQQHSSTQKPFAQDHLLDMKDAAARLSVSIRTIYRLVALGELAAPVKVGRASRMPASDLDRYIERLKSKRSA